MKYYMTFAWTIALIFLFNLNGIAQDSLLEAYHKDNIGEVKSAQRTNYLKPSSIVIPGAFILYGSLKPIVGGIKNLDENIFLHVKRIYPDFHTNADNYLMWAPSASIYLMDALKVKTHHSFREHLIIDAGSIIVTGGIGYLMRKISSNIKVYNLNDSQFPSGHTSNVFRGAEIFHQELKGSHEVLSYSGYLVAVSVGALRIYNKDHLLTEVIAGAGLGILSTKISYLVFNKIKYQSKKRKC